MNGYSVGYMPIEYKERVGSSKFTFVKDTYNYLMQVIRMVMYFDPLRVFLPICLSLFALGFFSSVYNLITKGGLEQSDVLIFVIAVLVGVIGLLSDLIVMQTKKNNY